MLSAFTWPGFICTTLTRILGPPRSRPISVTLKAEPRRQAGMRSLSVASRAAARCAVGRLGPISGRRRGIPCSSAPAGPSAGRPGRAADPASARLGIERLGRRPGGPLGLGLRRRRRGACTGAGGIGGRAGRSSSARTGAIGGGGSVQSRPRPRCSGMRSTSVRISPWISSSRASIASSRAFQPEHAERHQQEHQQIQQRRHQHGDGHPPRQPVRQGQQGCHARVHGGQCSSQVAAGRSGKEALAGPACPSGACVG